MKAVIRVVEARIVELDRQLTNVPYFGHLKSQKREDITKVLEAEKKELQDSIKILNNIK